MSSAERAALDTKRMFTEHLGGGAFMQRLRQKGWENPQIVKETARISTEEIEAVNAFAGGQIPEDGHPFKASLIFHTALRLLCEREGVMGYSVGGGYERETISATTVVPTGTDTDPYDDYDDDLDLEGEDLG